jgi:uncharacterized membrane protein
MRTAGIVAVLIGAAAIGWVLGSVVFIVAAARVLR